MTSELPKTFDPAAIEARWYAHWENEGLFRPERPHAQPFTIVNPPPNVTGSLHIGHALDNTLQDIVIRYERLRGKDALWVVGTDHAGIATQMVVERQMNAKGQKRTDFTRDEFVAKVWEWKEESGGEITRQLRRLGASMDWANERFTMDEGFSKAVIKVFVELYNRGLLYRDKRLVNWDPHFRTAISDLEVETKEVQGKFWHFRYPLEDGSGHISVATTRPETMLADMAVAVNPEDERYKALIGKNVRLPITGRLVPIVADEHADPELGSGAVKITPGHDFNDFEVGKRAGFKPAEMLNMLDADAKVVQTADGLIPEELLGLDRFEARKIVVSMIEDAGLLEQIEDRTIQTPYGDRSGAVIEPWLTDQWYVDAETLAKPAIEAVKSGKIEIVPKTWEKTYFNWMENIQPWCVSRQLWWGHQIPAWYDADGNVYVAEDEAGAQALAGNKLLTRDSDVLDTWFSSALWPFGTLGWPDAEYPPQNGEGDHAKHGGGGSPHAPPQGDSPLHRPADGPPPRAGEETSMLARHYPNDLLISGFDILFFWDARMIMQGLEFMKEVPFHRLYLHGLVRAADGSKMSKSKGNTVDPLGLIDKYGADALRFFMAAMESQGRDIKMDEKRVEGYRNFATKLWNAARFCQANGIGASHTLRAPDAELPVNRWIIAETVATVQALDLAMAELRFDAAANAIYHFVWDRFCDWYLELIKPLLNPPRDGEVAADASASDDGGGSPPALHQGESPLHRPADGPPPRAGEDLETRAVAGWVLDQILVMLHPFMPFVTEELWHAMGKRDGELIVAHWPQPDAHALDRAASEEIDWLIRLVSGVRTARAELNVPPGAKMAAYVRDASPATAERLQRQSGALARLARIQSVSFDAAPHGGAAQIVVDEATYVLPLEGVIDLAAEKARLAKAMDAAIKERDSLAKRLQNPAFVERAKPEAVEKARDDFADKSAEAERLQAALERLG
jgi:valyl-tRNA synthetase